MNQSNQQTRPAVADGNSSPSPSPFHDLEKRQRTGYKSGNKNVSNRSRSPLVKHLIAALGEFIGTVMFLFFAEAGTSIANTPTPGTTPEDLIIPQIIMTSLSFGVSLAVHAWIFFRFSGGLFNPAVSLALGLVGTLSPARVAILSVAQILGGIVAAALVQAMLPGPLHARTMLRGGTSVARGLFLEMFLTTMLDLTILFLAVEKHKATFLAPLGIGLALFLGLLIGDYPTGAALNPARAFGPDLVTRTFTHYHWIYWLGPLLGACLAAGIYKLFKILHYETITPDQDATDDEEAEENVHEAEDKDRKLEGKPAEEREDASKSNHLDSSSNGRSYSSFDHTSASRLERKVDQLLARDKQNRLENKLDRILASSTATDLYWRMGGAGKEGRVR